MLGNLSSSRVAKQHILSGQRETRYKRTNLSLGGSMLERMTRLKARPGNRFACSADPKSQIHVCPSVARLAPTIVSVFCPQCSAHQVAQIFTVHQPRGVSTVSLGHQHRCYQPRLHRGAMADGTMEGLAEMEDRRASQRENSVGDDLPALAWVANTPRRQPPDYPSLSDGAHPRYPIESTDKNLVLQTYFARSADDSLE